MKDGSKFIYSKIGKTYGTKRNAKTQHKTHVTSISTFLKCYEQCCFTRFKKKNQRLLKLKAFADVSWLKYRIY